MLLHAHEWGDPRGEPLVCLHGVTGYAGVYQRLAEERWSKRRVLAFDLRGHGHSGWEPPWTFATHVTDLAETMAALGLSAADWVGHSFGGRLILELASAHPQLVRRAGLLDPVIQLLPEVAPALPISSGESLCTGAWRTTSKSGCFCTRILLAPRSSTRLRSTSNSNGTDPSAGARARRRQFRSTASSRALRHHPRHWQRKRCCSMRPPMGSCARVKSRRNALPLATGSRSSRCRVCTWCTGTRSMRWPRRLSIS